MKKETYSKRESLVLRISVIDELINSLTLCVSNVVIDSTITDLFSLRNTLSVALETENLLESFVDYPWVIKKGDMPTYYQLLGINGKVVTLSRKGITKTISYTIFVRDFIEATDKEVIQHVEFLTKNSMRFLKNVVLSIKKPITPLGILKPITLTKSDDEEFYCVTLKKGKGCSVYHESYDVAEKEALRLSKVENSKAYILGVVGTAEMIPVTNYIMESKKF